MANQLRIRNPMFMQKVEGVKKKIQYLLRPVLRLHEDFTVVITSCTVHRGRKPSQRYAMPIKIYSKQFYKKIQNMKKGQLKMKNMKKGYKTIFKNVVLIFFNIYFMTCNQISSNQIYLDSSQIPQRTLLLYISLICFVRSH